MVEQHFVSCVCLINTPRRLFHVFSKVSYFSLTLYPCSIRVRMFSRIISVLLGEPRWHLAAMFSARKSLPWMSMWWLNKVQWYQYHSHNKIINLPNTDSHSHNYEPLGNPALTGSSILSLNPLASLARTPLEVSWNRLPRLWLSWCVWVKPLVLQRRRWICKKHARLEPRTGRGPEANGWMDEWLMDRKQWTFACKIDINWWTSVKLAA